MKLQACACCGLIHHMTGLAPHQVARCVRCGRAIRQPNQLQRSASRTAALALAAFLLYWPAILLPILEIERLGQHHRSSILSGTLDMLMHGEWFVGGIVLVFSIVFPLFKIVMLLELSLLELLTKRHRAITFRVMELVGKWGMLDVLLLALLVMLVKLGDLVRFQLGPAVLAFVLCVALSILAASLFDPHAIWQEDTEREQLYA